MPREEQEQPEQEEQEKNTPAESKNPLEDPDREAAREKMFRRFGSLVLRVADARDEVLDYIGDRIVEEDEVYEHLQKKSLENYYCIMIIQALSSYDKADSPWHVRCSLMYKQLFQGIERKYIKGFFRLQKRKQAPA